MSKPRLASTSDGESRRVFVDGTFGGGGHSSQVRNRFGESVRIIGLDRDPAVRRTHPEFEVRTVNFAEMDKLEEEPDAILLDLGFSSDQLESVPGLSFMKDELLDMRLSGQGETGSFTAAQVLNSWDESAIELILKGFGEERFAKRIAAEIVRRRGIKPFETTSELVRAIEAVVPGARGYNKINPATKTFQALRIAVNEELPNLEKGLKGAFDKLRLNGRLAVISFHSLEDRIVKNFFRDKAKEGEGRLVTKKPIVATEAEVAENPRARSAKLRIIEKI